MRVRRSIELTTCLTIMAEPGYRIYGEMDCRCVSVNASLKDFTPARSLLTVNQLQRSLAMRAEAGVGFIVILGFDLREGLVVGHDAQQLATEFKVLSAFAPVVATVPT